jgi:hypothetical protein
LLDEIAAALGHSKERQAELAAVAKTIDPLPKGERRWSEEIVSLFKAIPRQLEEPTGDLEVSFG